MTLYVSDLDGTLLRPDATISKAAAKKLNTLISNGVLFTYATARSFLSASPLVKALKLNCPAVTFNGVFVIDTRTGERIIENVFTKKAVVSAKKFLRENGFAPLVYSYIDGKERVSFLADKLEPVRNYVNSHKGDKRLRAVDNFDELFAGNVFYITVLNAESTAVLDSFFTRENGFERNFQSDTYDDTTWYEIYDKRAGKAAAALQLKALIGANKMICFGDNKNDIPMLQAADLGVAVQNSIDELKKEADLIIEDNENDAVAKFIEKREANTTDRFASAVEKALNRVKSTVGTQNEKLIHAALKNYYAPFSDEQEVKIGKYYADAVCENGIFEIQTKQLYRLREKLSEFLNFAKVNIVHPIICECKTVYINSDTGETILSDNHGKNASLRTAFDELYSIRGLLRNENLRIIIVRLKAVRKVYYHGEKIPDIRSKYARKKCVISKIPTEITEEIFLENISDYFRLLPEKLPENFTKKEFCKAAHEAESSLRLEVLREAGVIEKVGKRANAFVYAVTRR